jgi:SWI/SNF-related matrix-associated actin-dependent regulator 1 of chromatin subfamily A
VTALDLIGEREHSRKDLGRYVLEQNDLFSSSKFESLRTLLPDLISKDHRILIFSSWTSCLDLLGCLMQHLGILFQRMDGSTSSERRQELIDRFNNDRSYSVFLLSTKACGLGINLTSADTCILHDLDFNPFNDLQAEDRCHRIGQKKPVTVYKLISKDTVDEDIYKMQEKKVRTTQVFIYGEPIDQAVDITNLFFLGTVAGWKRIIEERKESVVRLCTYGVASLTVFLSDH